MMLTRALGFATVLILVCEPASAYLVWVLPKRCCNEGPPAAVTCPGGTVGAQNHAHGWALNDASTNSRALDDREVQPLEQHGCRKGCHCGVSQFDDYTFRFKITRTFPEY